MDDWSQFPEASSATASASVKDDWAQFPVASAATKPSVVNSKGISTYMPSETAGPVPGATPFRPQVVQPVGGGQTQPLPPNGSYRTMTPAQRKQALAQTIQRTAGEIIQSPIPAANPTLRKAQLQANEAQRRQEMKAAMEAPNLDYIAEGGTLGVVPSLEKTQTWMNEINRLAASAVGGMPVRQAPPSVQQTINPGMVQAEHQGSKAAKFVNALSGFAEPSSVAQMIALNPLGVTGALGVMGLQMTPEIIKDVADKRYDDLGIHLLAAFGPAVVSHAVGMVGKHGMPEAPQTGTEGLKAYQEPFRATKRVVPKSPTPEASQGVPEPAPAATVPQTEAQVPTLPKVSATDRLLSTEMHADLTGLPDHALDIAIADVQTKIAGYKAKKADTKPLDDVLQRLESEKQSRIQGEPNASEIKGATPVGQQPVGTEGVGGQGRPGVGPSVKGPETPGTSEADAQKVADIQALHDAAIERAKSHPFFAEPEPTPKAAEGAKEPWGMTRDEFASTAKVNRGKNYISVKSPHDDTSFVIRTLDTSKYSDADAIAKSHADYVRKASEEGKPVPAEVLKDYPDISPSEAKTAAGEKGRTAVRAATYRGEEGFTIKGKDGKGWQVSIFEKDRSEAERVRNAINSGKEPYPELQKRTVPSATPEGKANARGFTPSQESFLADKLKDAAKKLPIIDKSGEKRNFDASPVTIKVPGDGQFKVATAEQAVNLHKTVTGEPIPGVDIKPETTRYTTAKSPMPEHMKGGIGNLRSQAEVRKEFGITDKLKATEAAARKRIIEGGGRAQAGIPVDLMKDLAIVGAAKIARGTIEIARWGEEMVKDFGEKIRPHLQAIYDAAKAHYEENFKKGAEEGPKTEPEVRARTEEPAKEPETKPTAETKAEEAPKSGEGNVKPGGKTTGVRQASREVMAEEKRVGEYVVGKGSTPEELKFAGRQAIENGVKPEEHLAMMEKRGEAVSGRDMAILAAHDDALMQAADKARDASRANPNDPKLKSAADQATATEKKWYERISKYRTEWQKIGMAQQGEVDVDTGSFTSVARNFEAINNRPMDPKEEERVHSYVDMIKRLNESIEKKDIEIARLSKEHTSRPRTGKPKLPTDPGELAKHFDKRRQDGTLYGRKPMPSEAGAVRIRQGDPLFTLEELRAIQDHANTYFGKKNPATNRTYETADIAAKTAQELHLTTDEVLHAFSRNKTAPRAITDEQYAERAARRQAKKDSLAFIEHANVHPFVKGVRAIPNLYRSEKVFGHGTVGMTTHGGPNFLMPFSERKVYWPGQAKQLAMAFNKSLKNSEIIHEKMLTDIENHELYNKARRAGLKVDVYRAQDDIQQYARFLGIKAGAESRTAKAANVIARLSRRGDMGMDVLKWTRMEDFSQKWNNLEPALKTDTMARELSNMVNHVWGGSDARLGKVGGALFSPSLQGAHWARVIGDPAKTVATWADVTFNNSKNTSPEQVAIAKMRVKRAAEFAGVYGSVLLVNQAMLRASGQKDDVNFTNPTKADWMQPKWNGRTFAMGLSQGPVHILSQVIRDVKDSDARRLAQDVFRYGQGKLHPALGTALEVGMRKDYFGRPLPFASQEMKSKAKASGKEPVSWSEYAWSASPIPVEGVAKEYFESMRDNGISQGEALRIWTAIKNAAIVAPADVLGFRVGHSSKDYVQNHTSPNLRELGVTHDPVKPLKEKVFKGQLTPMEIQNMQREDKIAPQTASELRTIIGETKRYGEKTARQINDFRSMTLKGAAGYYRNASEVDKKLLRPILEQRFAKWRQQAPQARAKTVTDLRKEAGISR